MIFPIVFANNLDPGSGPGLIFRTLPTAFAEMPGGALFGTLFFVLLAFAAVTSIIAIIEPIVAFAEDRWRMRRTTGCIVFGFIAWATGIATVLSFNAWSDVTPLAGFASFADMNIFALIDYFTANLLMPLGGILMALFVGWLVRPAVLAEDLFSGKPLLFTIWLWMVRLVAPLAIVGVLYTSL
jgi:NSS family neurotransmitter:Na+ symporter